jgi:hypothetical protein
LLLFLFYQETAIEGAVKNMYQDLMEALAKAQSTKRVWHRITWTHVHQVSMKNGKTRGHTQSD